MEPDAAFTFFSHSETVTSFTVPSASVFTYTVSSLLILLLSVCSVAPAIVPAPRSTDIPAASAAADFRFLFFIPDNSLCYNCYISITLLYNNELVSSIFFANFYLFGKISHAVQILHPYCEISHT